MKSFPSKSTEIILVVDDDEGICSVLQTGVERAGFQCFTAQRPKAALQLLDQHPVDVVVADIRMPEMSGIELAHVVKARFPADVIIMTGFVEDFNYEDIIQQGASDFIQKPVRIAEFVARLKRVLSERSSRAERDMAMENLKVNLDKLGRAMDGIVKAMSVAVELRDPYTAGHQERVATLTSAIGRHMGLSEDDVYGLRMASVIHDLGKMAVPAEILCKPGKLSPLEYEMVKIHVQAGYDILKRIEFPWPVAEIVLQHHERVNGSGYPNGLQQEEILLPARILAVADVYETIASHRPYRPALGTEAATEEIRSHRGILYDRQVVDACLALIKSGDFQFSG
ncbi:MAG: response regulator [Desulfobacteraceae bacterium]|nr:response regulator [Desulfobacteraceae bacterium]